MSPCSPRWPASLSASPSPPASGVGGLRGGGAGARRGRAAGAGPRRRPGSGDRASTAATLARQVQELRQRQRAVWQQLSDAYGTPGAGWDASRMASLRQTHAAGGWRAGRGHGPLTAGLSPVYRARRPGADRGAGGAGAAPPRRGLDQLVHAPRPGAGLAGAAGPGAGVPRRAHRQGGADGDGGPGAPQSRAGALAAV